MSARTFLFSALFLFGCSGGATPEATTDAAPGNDAPSSETATTDAEPEVETDAAKPPSPDCTGKKVQPRDATWKIVTKGSERVADVHVPATYDPSRKTPVVLSFHGYTSNARQQAVLAKMIAKSDAEGFIVVHPEGTGGAQSWNAGACCGTAASNGVDDVRFVSDLLDEVESRLCVDTQRVFATGMSNGGFLSHRLACELSDRIAAIAPVAGVIGVTSCTPKRPVPVMHFHGTYDTLVPYRGDRVKSFPSVAETIEGWSKRNGCTGAAFESFRKADTHCETRSACEGGADVVLCTVEGGGHTWPGGTPVPSLGHTTTALSATDAMWDFFSKHPLPR